MFAANAKNKITKRHYDLYLQYKKLGQPKFSLSWYHLRLPAAVNNIWAPNPHLKIVPN